MILASRTSPDLERSPGSQPTGLSGYTTLSEAMQANAAFDSAVQQFLQRRAERNAFSLSDHENTLADLMENSALRSFFVHYDDAFEQLLDEEAIARHLLRPITGVYFEGDAYEPLLSRYERRIYNLAMLHRQQEIPFRYSPPNRQNSLGDTLIFSDLPTDQVREDIGMYFGTRRSDETALTLLANQLRQEAWPYSHLPIHVVTEGYMDESLRAIKAATEQLCERGDRRLHCFLIQRRHAADDRHLGAALLLMNPAQPNQPQRLIFCDTLNPHGRPPWWDKFCHKVDAVFPQPAEKPPVSERLEDGGVNLQRLHDGVPIRHQDIDCAFYTFSMVRALIGIAKAAPHLILHAPIEKLVSLMTARMPEYFEQANQAKDPGLVREENVVLRWEAGREALKNIQRRPAIEVAMPQPVAYEISC